MVGIQNANEDAPGSLSDQGCPVCLSKGPDPPTRMSSLTSNPNGNAFCVPDGHLLARMSRCQPVIDFVLPQQPGQLCAKRVHWFFRDVEY